MEICVDFDGTCVTHEFPGVGKDIGAARVLTRIIEAGHNIILFTMRSNQTEAIPYPSSPEIKCETGYFLNDALAWFDKNEIPLYGINRNPTQDKWTTSPKAYGQIYIDDAALGIPLTTNYELSERPYVNWNIVETWLENRAII